MSTTEHVLAFFDGSTAIIFGYVEKAGGGAGQVVAAAATLTNGVVSSAISYYGNPSSDQATRLSKALFNFSCGKWHVTTSISRWGNWSLLEAVLTRSKRRGREGWRNSSRTPLFKKSKPARTPVRKCN
jgi:hypothetical protein